MADNEAIIEIRAAIEDVQKKMNEIQGLMQNTSSKSEFAWTSSLKKIAGMFGIAFSAREVINFAKESINAFANTERSAVVLNNTLKNFGVSDEGIRSIEDTVSRLEKLTSFDDSQIRSALSNAVIKLGDVNLAMRTVEVAMEVARARNLDLNDAVQRLSLGLLGNARGLRDLGINIKDFGDNAQLTAEQKLSILDTVLNKVKGSVDEFNKTTSGSMEKMATSFENFKEAVGRELAPMVKDISDATATMLDKITDAMNKSVDSMEKMKKEVSDLGAEAYTVIDTFGGLDLSSRLEDTTKKMDSETKDWKSKIYSNIHDASIKASEQIKNIGKSAQATGEDIKKSFEFWKPINLIGGNLPELAKFVGNLRNATITKKIVIDVNVKDQTSKNSQIGKAVGDTILDGLAYESHGTGGW
jgi:predicted Zn-dependent protease with MMP-like domain